MPRRTFFLPLLLLPGLVGCTDPSDSKSHDILTSDTLVSYLALGDSYTIGESVPPTQR
jgi:hypothetical protein